MAATCSNIGALLHQMFDAAIAAALPSRIIPGNLPSPPKGRTIVLGAGKASAAMAAAMEEEWLASGNAPPEGLVVTRYGHSVPCKHIEIIEAAHPLPDEAGRKAAVRILDFAKSAGPDDLVIFLISGGGSALLTMPAEGVTFADKQSITAAMLKSGVDIAGINTVRRHLSAIKGGQLAAATNGARMLTLVISDVPGDDVSAIASGPTVADSTSFADALAILQQYEIAMPISVRDHLQQALHETPKPGDPRLANSEVKLLATPMMSLAAAAAIAREAGYTPLILGDALEGDAVEMGKVLAGIALSAAKAGQPLKPPCVLLSGGETTVSVRGKGIGGRNVEFLLSLAIALKGVDNIWALAADSDGIDGIGEAAGAIIRPDTLDRARQKKLNPALFQHNNDAHSFFAALGDSIITGPTLTNVNDFRAIVIGQP